MAQQSKGVKAQPKYVTRRFPKDIIKDVLFEDEMEFEGKSVTLVKDKITDNTRWHVQHDVVIAYDEKFYSFSYQRGATEYQDEGPEFHTEYGGEIEVTEVEAVPVTVIKYKPVVQD